MRVTLSRHIGFCGGVTRSIAIAYDAVKNVKGNAYTDGELVHNSNTLARLEQIGIKKLPNELKLCQSDDSIIIRAHGVTPARKAALHILGCKVIDATCPKVLKIAELIEKYAGDGYHIILVGDANHPEIIGLCGYVPGEKITVLSSTEEVFGLKISHEKIVVLSQTTFECELFEEIARTICKQFRGAIVSNTICPSAANRQREVAFLSRNGCDCIVVVGGKLSKNAKSLKNTAETNGCCSLIIEHENDPTLTETERFSHVAIVSGTSTDYQDACAVYKKLLSLVPK
jgi:4-hydroxy-3-methylbut-2-enyl diphosphate reductase